MLPPLSASTARRRLVAKGSGGCLRRVEGYSRDGSVSRRVVSAVLGKLMGKAMCDKVRLGRPMGGENMLPQLAH